MSFAAALLSAALALQAAPAAGPGAAPAERIAAAAPTPPAAAAREVPPVPAQVMAIPESLRDEFRARVIDTTNVPELRVRRMVAFMFDKDGLGLQYKGDATRTVAESYRTREVNCLSFTLLAVALAREAGLDAHGQQIDRVLAWNLVGDVVMQSLHANAVLTVKDRNLQVKDGRDFVLDIVSNGLYSQEYIVHDYKVRDDQLLASFYGNRAMELLAQGKAEDATDWLAEALRLDPENAMLWNNAGVLSQRQGDAAEAERRFLGAVRRNPVQTSALFNLVAMYQATDDAARAEYWQERATRVLRRDPFYQFSMAERDARSGNYEGAVRYYRRAIALDRRERLFHFGLARAWVQLGKMDKAERELNAAYELSEGADRQRFQAKLEALRTMALR